jgi:hypothetical protein
VGLLGHCVETQCTDVPLRGNQAFLPTGIFDRLSSLVRTSGFDPILSKVVLQYVLLCCQSIISTGMCVML